MGVGLECWTFVHDAPDVFGLSTLKLGSGEFGSDVEVRWRFCLCFAVWVSVGFVGGFEGCLKRSFVVILLPSFVL